MNDNSQEDELHQFVRKYKKLLNTVGVVVVLVIFVFFAYSKFTSQSGTYFYGKTAFYFPSADKFTVLDFKKNKIEVGDKSFDYSILSSGKTTFSGDNIVSSFYLYEVRTEDSTEYWMALGSEFLNGKRDSVILEIQDLRKPLEGDVIMLGAGNSHSHSDLDEKIDFKSKDKKVEASLQSRLPEFEKLVNKYYHPGKMNEDDAMGLVSKLRYEGDGKAPSFNDIEKKYGMPNKNEIASTKKFKTYDYILSETEQVRLNFYASNSRDFELDMVVFERENYGLKPGALNVYSDLKVGEKNGEGGTDFESISSKIGVPRTESFTYNGDATNLCRMISYKSKDDKESYSFDLTFRKQDDGRWLLSYKNATGI